MLKTSVYLRDGSCYIRVTFRGRLEEPPPPLEFKLEVIKLHQK